MTGTTEYVVTYRIEYYKKQSADDCLVHVHEFFRGSKKECLRIASAFGGTANDTRLTKQSCVIVGNAKHWDEFCQSECVGLDVYEQA